jgi:hypothetical protein
MISLAVGKPVNGNEEDKGMSKLYELAAKLNAHAVADEEGSQGIEAAGAALAAAIIVGAVLGGAGTVAAAVSAAMARAAAILGG